MGELIASPAARAACDGGEAALIRAARADPAAFDALYRRYRDRL